MKAARHVRSISDLGPGDHACCFLESEEERLAVIKRFVGDGLEQGDRVLYIYHGRGRPEVLDMLEDAGVAHRDHVAGGALVFASSADTYLDGGVFDRERMLERLRGEIDGAASDGYRALRVTGEMGWTREASLEPGALLLYELEADALVETSACTALCQYMASECGTTEMLSLLEAHPLIAVSTEVFSNPFFIPGTAFSGSDSQAGFLRQVIHRIEERELADVSLERERARALEYFEMAGTMLVALDRDGKVSSINRKGLEVLGYEAEELIGRSWFDTCLPESTRDDVRVVFVRLMCGESVALRRYDNPVVTISGEERTISWFNVVLADADGRPGGTLSSGEDVTEERRAEKIIGIQRQLALRSLETADLAETARFSLDAMLEAAGLDSGGIYLVDENNGALRLLHHSGLSDEFAREVAAYAPGSPNWWLISEGEPVYFNYTDGQLPLGEVKRREGIKAIVIIPLVHDGHVVGCVNASSHTIEEIDWWSREAIEGLAGQVGLAMSRSLLESKFRASEAKYHELVESANSIILKVDGAGNLTFLNEYGQEFFEYSEDEVLGRNLIGTIIPRTESSGRDLGAMVKDALENPDAYINNENENIKKSGERVWVSWTNRAILDEEGRLAGILAVGNDVTERKGAEEALGEALSRLSRLTRTTPVYIYEIDADGTITFVNRTFEGLTEDDVVGTGITGWFPEEWREPIGALLQEVMTSGESRSIEYAIPDPQGETHSYLTRIDPVTSNGATKTAVLTATDVTERRRAEEERERLREELALAGERWDRSLRQMDECVCIIGEDFTIVQCNEAFGRLVGRDHRSLAGEKCHSLVHGTHEPPEYCATVQAVRDGAEYCTELFEPHLNRHLEIVAQPVLSASGVVDYTMHIIRDVSERKSLEEDLRRSEERYRLFYEYAGEAIYTYDRDLTLTGVNRVACELLGYEQSELVGKHIEELGLLHPDDLEKAFSDIGRLFAGEPVIRDRLRFIRRDGSVILADVTGAGLYRGDEIVGITNIALDITERAAAEEAVLKHSQQLKDLVDVAAHEIRHPAAVLKGYAVTLLAYGGSIDSQMARDALTAIDRASDRLADMVSQLLDTSSIERGRYEVVMHEVEPEEVILEAVEEMRAKGLENEFVLRRAVKGGTFIADGEKVRQAVLVLLDNAARYSPPGSEVELWYEWRGREVVFCVADRGPGIVEADRGSIFERFYQVEDVAHHSIQGLGLGLYIASRIVDAHGGWIRVDPRPQRGSVFRFGLPALPPGATPPGAVL